jgi:uncharacterized protein YqeY
MIDIDNLIAEARKEQNPIKLEAFKQVKQEFLLRKTKGEDINSNIEVAVLKKLVGHYGDQAQMYQINGREEIANEYKAYANELKKLLPEMMSVQEIETHVDYIIAQNFNGMPTKKDMGKIIKMFKDSYSNADGAVLANVVKSRIFV